MAVGYNAFSGSHAAETRCLMETVHAIYEGGVFRPTQPVPLPDKCEVEFEPRVVNGELTQDLDAIYAVLDQRYNSGEHDVAERHNEPQP